MKSKQNKGEIQTPCSVCLERNANSSLDNCTHQFCIRCIKKWSKKHNTCPLCRTTYRQIMHKGQNIPVNPPPAPSRYRRPSQMNPPQRRMLFLPVISEANYFQSFMIPTFSQPQPIFSPPQPTFSFLQPTFFFFNTQPLQQPIPMLNTGEGQVNSSPPSFP